MEIVDFYIHCNKSITKGVFPSTHGENAPNFIVIVKISTIFDVNSTNIDEHSSFFYSLIWQIPYKVLNHEYKTKKKLAKPKQTGSVVVKLTICRILPGENCSACAEQ